MIVRTPLLSHFRRGVSSGVFSRGWLSGFSPLKVPNLATWYDLSNTSSYITDTGVKLLGDLSGNSNVNVLALNGVAGNWASAPNTTAAITGDIDIRVNMFMFTWTGASIYAIVAKYNAAGSRSYLFEKGPSGALKFSTSVDGTAVVTGTSTANISESDYSSLWIRVTREASSGNENFYTSNDGSNWTQLGTQVSVAAAAIFNSTALLGMGCRSDGTTGPIPARISRVLIYSAIGSATNTGTIGSGSPSFDSDFSTFTKLATSGTAITGQTVTINTTGDLGARICGARDEVQMTAAKQPTLSGGGMRFTAAASQFMRSSLYSTPQPITRFTVINQAVWASGKYLLDGGGGANSCGVIQTTSTPQINLNAGSSVAANTDLTVGSKLVLVQVINGASSSLQVDNNAATTGNAGAGTPNGLTFGADGQSTAANFSDVIIYEDLTYLSALDAPTISRIKAYLMAKWSA